MKVFLFLSFFVGCGLWAQPRHIVCTYMGDPATTLTVNWQSGLGGSLPEIRYDTIPNNQSKAPYRHTAKGISFEIPGLEDRSFYRVSLEDLEPATTYYLRVGTSETGFSREIKVKTIPNDDRDLRFVTGGDMGVSEDTRILLRHSATHDPDFAVIGGDIAYANGKLSAVDKWDTWMDYYTEEMVTPDGYTIPLVLAIGNHEVNGAYNKSKEDAPFFFGLFGQEEDSSTFARQFGENFVLFVLDSGHVATHESQVDWLRNAFETYVDVPQKAAVYHVPLFPSHRDFMGHFSDQGRQYWAPVFDEFGLTVAFENHDHTFKRSQMIKDGEVQKDGEGTLYLGDGCWGRDSRTIHYIQPDYLKVSGSIQHFWVVDCSAEKMVYRAVDIQNQVFDVYPETEPGFAEARRIFDQKNQVYILPEGVLSLEEEGKENGLWPGGKVTFTMTNPFDEPLTIQITAQFDSDKVVSAGVPFDVQQLSSGEKASLTASFERVPGVGDQWVTIHGTAEFQDPKKAKPAVFKNRFSLKLYENTIL